MSYRFKSCTATSWIEPSNLSKKMSRHRRTCAPPSLDLSPCRSWTQATTGSAVQKIRSTGVGFLTASPCFEVDREITISLFLIFQSKVRWRQFVTLTMGRSLET